MDGGIGFEGIFLARFEYKAVDNAGSSVSGSITAPDRRAAVTQLAGRGEFATEVYEQSQEGESQGLSENVSEMARGLRIGSSRIGGKDVLTMTNHLSTAINAGLPLLNAIEIVGAQQHKKPMKELFGRLADSVSGGKSFSDALEEHPKEFSRLYVSMVRVGETGGILEKTMSQLTQLLGREVKIKSNMASAMIYPMIVLVVGVLSVIAMVTLVVPKIIATLGEGVILPWPTRSLMSLSAFIKDYGLLIAILIIASVAIFKYWKNTPSGKGIWDGFLLKIPVLGSVLTTIAVGRFARTLGALTSSGITILHALGVVRDTLGNEVLGRQIDDVSEKVRMGQSLAEPLAKSSYFPPLLIQIVSVGEQTGKLDELLLNAADTFDEEADSAVGRFMALFPVLLILMLALVIGYIIAATLLPIMTLDLTGIGV